MTISLECPRCGRRLQMREEVAGQDVKCPSCGSVWTPAADPPAQPPGAYALQDDRREDAVRPGPASAAPGAGPDTCPNCGVPLAAEAVLCVDCGFNRKTGKQLKTVSQRFERHWDDGNFPYWGRLIACILLLGVSLVPLLFDNESLFLLLLTIWILLLLPLTGTFKRVTITRDQAGRAILVRRWWVCLVPVLRVVTPLGDGYERIRTGLSGGGSVLFFVVLFLLCGLPGVIYALIRGVRSNGVTLEILGDHGGRDVEPITVYRGGNDEIMRQIGDTLKGIGGLHYG